MPSATNKTSIRDGLNGGLIASCQPVANGAMDTDDMVIAMAQACEDGGATAVRIEGVTRVRKVAEAIKIPVVESSNGISQTLRFALPHTLQM